MSEVKERSELDPNYCWDLSSLYESDEAWEADLASLDVLTEAAEQWHGQLNTAENILAYFESETALERKLNNLFTYASLRQSEDMRDAKSQERYGRIYGKYVGCASRLSFATPEILKLTTQTLVGFKDDPLLKDYRFQMERLIKEKAHVLSEEEETLLTKFTEVLNGAGDTADALMDADLTFDAVQDSEGNDHEVSAATYILSQMSHDRTLRENSFRSFYKGYKGHIHTFASLYATNVKNAVVEASVRHYESSRSMALSENNIPLSVYDNLIDAVHRHMPAMHAYAAFRKEVLGVDELHYYDVYTPLVTGDTKRYTYEEACQTVLDTVSILGESYRSTVENAFKDGWIDVYPNKGKAGGAFSSGTYDSKPYIMTNFTGTLDSVSTIAHEMGHSMHTWLAKHHQLPQSADYTLFVAEVASTVNENLLIEHLLEKETDPQARLALLNQYLENFKGTVYRQTMFAEFEKEAHAMIERGEALSSENLSNLYEGLVKEYFGDALVFDEEVRYEWARIPHFYRPFYVYVYATGYSAAVAISEDIRHHGEASAKRYLEFLSMGGSAWPLDELKHANVDLTTSAPIDAALEKFEAVLKEAQSLYKQLRGA